MSDDLQSTLLARFPYLTPRAGSADHPAVNVPAENLISFATALRDELGFDMLTDIAGADWDQETPRFAAVYHFVRTAGCEYLRVVCAAPDDAAPAIPSLVALYPSANWFEREAYDMFGIHFAGHPDLRRILMWDSYPWHPLRKEFPLAGKEADIPSDDQIEGARTQVRPAPLAGGPFVATPGKTMHDGEPHGKDQSWSEANPKKI